MPLSLEIIRVRKVSPVAEGETRMIDDNHLLVDDKALADSIKKSDPRILELTIDIVEPGDSTRITCVKDVVEPRFSPEEDRLRILDSVAVVTCGPIVGFQEGIIDMAGPGSKYHPFSKKHLVVIRLVQDPKLTPHQHEEVVRLAGLHAADQLARHVSEAPPDETRIIDPRPLSGDHDLPRLVYLYMVLSQGLLHDTWVEDINARNPGFEPKSITPQSILTNGIISGNCVSACDKNTTWHHQNNPVLMELIEGHGTRWNFAGVIVTNEPTRLSGKKASAEKAVALALDRKPDGVVITKEGFGNPDADLMMLIHGLETAGVRTVAITDEYAGCDGASPSLADSTPEANALISTGNANARIALPPLMNTIGPLEAVPRLAGSSTHCLLPDGSLEVEIQALIGATNQLGTGHLRCHEI